MTPTLEGLPQIAGIFLTALVLVVLLTVVRVFVWWAKNVVRHRLPKPFLGEGSNKEWADLKRAELKAGGLDLAGSANGTFRGNQWMGDDGTGMSDLTATSGISDRLRDRRTIIEAPVGVNEQSLLRDWLAETGHVDDEWAEKLLGKSDQVE